MDYPEFLICINSLHFPPTAEDSSTWDKIDSDSRTILSSLYNWLRSRMKTAAKPAYVAGRLNGSVFSCCLSDGLVMLLCRADPIKRDVDVSGFFIHRDESLRTAWQLSRVPLLFICAGGWDKFGTVLMTPDDIERKAASLRFPPEYQSKLVGMAAEMISSEIPFSFALSSYPVNNAPLKFTSAHTQNEALQGDSSAIVINPDTLRACKVQVLKKYHGVQMFELVCTGRKQFLELKLSELSDRGAAKKEKAILKDMLSRYPSDDIWYIRVVLPEGEFSELLDQYTSKKLCSGAIPFEELVFAMKRAESAARNFFREQGGPQNRQPAEGSVSAVSPQSVEKSKFGRFLKK